MVLKRGKPVGLINQQLGNPKIDGSSPSGATNFFSIFLCIFIVKYCIQNELMLTKREGLMLYWCEGDKYTSKNKYKIAVTSTESRMILLFVEWLNKYYSVNRSKIKLRLHLWNIDIEQEAKEY